MQYEQLFDQKQSYNNPVSNTLNEIWSIQIFAIDRQNHILYTI